MSRWTTPVVRGIAVLSFLTSVATLVLADLTGPALPVQTINLTVIAGGAAVMSVLLHQRTPDNNLWRVLLLIAVAGPVAVVLYAVASGQSEPPEALVGAVWLLDVALVMPWMLFIGLFPDGHRPLPWWPWLVLVGALALTLVSLAAWLSAPASAPLPVPGHLPGAADPDESSTGFHAAAALTASLMAGLLPLVAAVCLAHRYRRSGPVMRQQIRVGAAGLTAAVVLEVVLRTLPWVDAGKVHFTVALVAVGVGGFAVAAGLFRWRLWFVDQALPRAVVLGALSACFTALIVLVAVIATGGGLDRAQVQGAIIAAVVVTVLVQGYSRRLEPWVRRVIYGERPGGYAALAGLADGLAGVDERTAAGRITDAAREGLAVPWAALWAPTARPGLFRLVSRTGDVAAPDVVRLSDVDLVDPASRLLVSAQPMDSLPEETAAVTQLCSEGSIWGLLAVGQRRGEPLTIGDLELLGVIAREAALARENRRLIDEVAASVEELRERARQLQDSRQRLVAAQDEERRRIERDLHDGAQHELITLAGRLRTLSKSATPQPGTFEELADQAERAVFSLQDLARGIYPSVLTDHGVAAAIRSYIARLPIDVAIETAPETARRRWPAELEVALYFVAVEALGNSRKHARASVTTVTLAERGCDVVLEIHDNGVGFDANAVDGRSGMQHMSDRIAALGGRLVVESRPSAGTWVTATAPVPAPPPARTIEQIGDQEVTGRLPTPGDRATPPVRGG